MYIYITRYYEYIYNYSYIYILSITVVTLHRYAKFPASKRTMATICPSSHDGSASGSGSSEPPT